MAGSQDLYLLGIGYKHVKGGEDDFASAGKKIKDSAKEAAEGSKAFEKGLDSVKDSIKDVVAEAAALVAAYVSIHAAIDGVLEGVKLFAEFDKGTAQLRALTQATAGDFDLLSESAREIGASTIFGAAQAAAGMTVLSKAGESTRDVLASMKDVEHLAIIGHEDLAAAADDAALTLHRFNLNADQTGHVVDVLATLTTHSRASVGDLVDVMKQAGPAAGAMGLKFEDLAAVLGVMSQQGGNARASGSALVNVLAVLSNPTKQVQNDLKLLGLSLSDLSPRTHSLVQILETLGRANLDAGSAFALFGHQAGGAILQVVQNLPQLHQLRESLGEVDDAGARLAETMENNLSSSGERLEKVLDAVKLSIGAGLAPALSEVSKGLQDSLRDWQSGAEAFGRGMGKVLLAVVDGFVLVVTHGREVAAVLVGIGVAVAVVQFGPLILAAGQYVVALVSLAASEGIVAVATAEMSLAWGTFTAALAANPVGLVAVALAALAAVIYEVVSRSREASAAEEAYQKDLASSRPVIEGVTYAHAQLADKLREELALRQKLSTEVDDLKARYGVLQTVQERLKTAAAAGDSAGYAKAAEDAQKLGVALQGYKPDTLRSITLELTALAKEIEAAGAKTVANNERVATSQRRLKEDVVQALDEEFTARLQKQAQIADLDAKLARAQAELNALINGESLNRSDSGLSPALQAAIQAVTTLEQEAAKAKTGLAAIGAELDTLKLGALEAAQELARAGKIDQAAKIYGQLGIPDDVVAKGLARQKELNDAAAKDAELKLKQKAAADALLASQREQQRLYADEIKAAGELTRTLTTKTAGLLTVAAAYRISVAAGEKAKQTAEDEAKATEASAKFTGARRAAIHDLTLANLEATRVEALAEGIASVRLDTDRKLKDSKAKLLDVVNGNTAATTAAATAYALEEFRVKNITTITKGQVAELGNLLRQRDAQLQADTNEAAAQQRRLDLSIALRTAEAALRDAQEQSQQNAKELDAELEVEAALRAANLDWTKQLTLAEWLRVASIRAAIIEGRQKLDVTARDTAAAIQATAAQRAYRSALATVTDDEARLRLTQQYGAGISSLVVALGGASQATRQLAIDEAVLAEAEAEHAKGVVVDIAAIRARITSQQQAVNELHDGFALVQANADVWAPVQDGLTQVGQLGFDTFNQLVETGHISAQEIGKSLLDILLKTFEQIFANWVKLQIAMATVEKERQIASINSSTGTSGVGPVASAGQYGSLLSSGGSSSSFLSAYGGALAVVAAFVVAYLVGNDILNSRARNAFGYPGTYGVSGGNEIQIGETSIINSIKDFVKQFEQLAGATITDLDTIGVKVQASGHRFRAYVGDVFVGEFDYMSQAIGTAFSIAIKNAKFSGPISTAVSELLATRDFTSADDFAAALKVVAAGLAQNLPQLALDFRKLNQDMDEQVKAQHDVYLRYSSAGFQALFTEDVRHYTDGLDAIRKGITGQQESAYVVFEQQRQAFNAEIASRRLAIQVQVEETKAKLAALGVTLETLEVIKAASTLPNDSGSSGAGNYNHGGGPTGPNGGFLGPNGGAGPTITNPGYDPNAAKNQGITELKALLDLLLKELGALPAAIAASDYRNPRSGQYFAQQFDDAESAIQRLALTLADGTKGAEEFNSSLSGMLSDLAQSLNDQRDAITGRQRTAEEDLQLRRQQAVAWNAEKALREAELVVQIETIKGKIAEAEASRAAALVSIQSAAAQGQAAIGLAEVVAATAGITDAQLAAMQQQLAALQGVLATIQNIKPIDPSEILRTGGGGTGGNTAQQRQDALTAMNAELEKLARTNLPASVNAIVDLGIQLADLTKRTQEAHASEELLAKARQALIDQAKRQLLDPIREALLPGQGGTYGVSAQEKQRLDTLKLFDDAEAAQRKLIETTGQRAIAFWQLNDAKIRALNALAEQDIAGLNLPMEQTRKRVSDLRDSLGFLWTSFLSGALSAERLVDALHQVTDQAGGELLGLAEGILSSMGQTAEAAKVKQALDIANFDLQVLQLNFLYQQYLALGIVSEAVKATLDEALGIINDPKNRPTFAPVTTAAAASSSLAANDNSTVAADDARRQAILDQIKAWNQLGDPQTTTALRDLNATFVSMRADALRLGVSLADLQSAYGKAVQNFWDTTLAQYEQPGNVVDQLAAINKTFDELIAAARQYGGDQARIERDRLAEVKRFWDTALQPIRDLQSQLAGGKFGGVSPEAALSAARRNFQELAGKAVAGDAASIAAIPAAVQDLLNLQKSFSGTGPAYQALVATIQGVLAQIVGLGAAGAAAAVQPPAAQALATVLPFPGSTVPAPRPAPPAAQNSSGPAYGPIPVPDPRVDRLVGAVEDDVQARKDDRAAVAALRAQVDRLVRRDQEQAEQIDNLLAAVTRLAGLVESQERKSAQGGRR